MLNDVLLNFVILLIWSIIITNSSSDYCRDKKFAKMSKNFESTRQNIFAYNSSSLDCIINYFDVSEISIATLNVIREKKSLRKLDLSANRISEIRPDTFDQFESLVILKIARNFLVRIENHYFRNGLKELSVVDLSSNLIQSVDEMSFQNLESLLWLNLADNCLTRLSVELPFTDFDTLNLSQNLLESFPRLRMLRALTTLDLSHNILEVLKFSTEFSRVVNSLKSLNIADNRLSNLHQLHSFSSLVELNIASNPINFDENVHLLTSQKLLGLRKLNLTAINLHSLESLVNDLNCNQFTALSIDGNPLKADFRMMKCFNNLQHLRFSQKSCQKYENFYREVKLNFPHLSLVEIEYEEPNCNCAIENHEIFAFFRIAFSTNWSQMCSKGQQSMRVKRTHRLLLILGLIAFLSCATYN